LALLHVVFRASSLLYYKHKATAHSRGKLCILLRRLVVVFCVISVVCDSETMNMINTLTFVLVLLHLQNTDHI